MRCLIGGLFFFCLGGCLLTSLLHAEEESPIWTLEHTLSIKRVSDVRVSPDGERLAMVVATPIMTGEISEWRSQIHVCATDGSNGFQLTRGEFSSLAPAWSPDGKQIAFVSARGDKARLWKISLAGGEAEPLTAEQGEILLSAWSPDGSQLAFLMRDPKTAEEELADKEKRDARVVDGSYKHVRLYVVNAEPDAAGERGVRLLTREDFTVGNSQANDAMDWSPDGRHLVFSHQPTPRADDWTRSDVSIVEVASGKVRSLVATGAAESQPFFSPDGSHVAYVASDDPPTWAFTGRVHLISLEGGSPRALGESFDQRPTLLGWNPDGTKLLIHEARGTLSRISTMTLHGSVQDISPEGMLLGRPTLDASRRFLGFTSEDVDRPAEAWSMLVAGGPPRQASRVQAMPSAPLAKTELLTWKSTDGMSIEGLLTFPTQPAPQTRMPLLVVIHGGPAGVFAKSFIGAAGPYPLATLASKGYAILRVNPRGSSGYGREFRYANYRDWGGGDYRDIMACVDELIGQGLVDPDRMGVMGWSYGGFMTSWIITQTSRFKAASVGAGVTNLMSFTGTADIPNFVPDYFGGEYWQEFDRWRAHSAMFNVGGATTPTLIQHGEADLRVPVSQGYELYNALRRQGVEVQMVVYPRQAHAITEPKLLLDAMQRNVAWFERLVPATSEPRGN